MKTYYKFRPRAGETVINYDMMHPSGVVVDGHLTFLKDDGSPFIATFEATSAATAAEVRFRLQRKQLFWDALSVGCVAAAVAITFFWIFNLWTLAHSGWLFSILLTLALLFLGGLGFHMFFRNNERYRYIYATEQFKQYHADEQWIALADDVFSTANDPYFIELKTQCVKNGFGLVTVDHEEHVNLLITPAREEVFGRKRRALKFSEATPSVSQPLQGLQRLSPKNLERFSRSYGRQLAICAGAAVFVSGIFYRSWSLSPTDFVANEDAHRDSLALKAATNMAPEKDPLVYNSSQTVPFNSKTKPFGSAEPVSTTPQPQTPQTVRTPPKPEIGLYVYTATDGYLTYDCGRIDMRGTKFIVQDLICATFEEAHQRTIQLKTYGLIANAISLACTTNSTTNGYCVYHEAVFNDANAANRKANQIKLELGRLNLPNEFIKIRTLEF